MAAEPVTLPEIGLVTVNPVNVPTLVIAVWAAPVTVVAVVALPSKFAISVAVSFVNAKPASPEKSAPLVVNAILNLLTSSSKPINALLCEPRLMIKPASFTGTPAGAIPFCNPSKVSE